MNKNIYGTVVVLLASLLAVSANATPISTNSTQLKPFDEVRVPVVIEDSTLLKIFRGAGAPLLDLSSADSAATRIKPTLVTQAMSPPSGTTARAPSSGAQALVVVVSEPSLLLLIGFGLLLAGVSRRNA
ncbi:MAG: hypothetical protein OER80_00745 [Gammaproteobacteria bacterium]|nr:hypothetical protein [Gammaproteobacteria bacterium]